MSELFNVNQRLDNFIKKQLAAKGETTDENRPIGSKATLNGKDVFWSGQNYGWQSQESFNKLKEGPEFRAGHIALSRLGTDINQAIGMGVDALPEPVKATGIEAIRQGVQAYQKLPQGVRTGIRNVVQTAGAVNEEVSKRTNVSPIITGEALTAAATAGVGNTVKRAATGMNAVDTLTDATKLGSKPGVDYYLTITNPDSLARGAAKGWAEGAEFGPEMTKWRNRRMELREQMRNPQGTTAYRREKNRNKAQIRAYNDVSTGPTRFADNPEAYGVDKFKQQSSVDSRNMEQHHLFPKQESYQFVERMLEVGDEDDVLNLMIYAEEVDASMGGRLDNMLNMDRQPHTILHNSRKAIEDGRQLKSIEMKNKVNSAKTSDELMELFKEYLETNIKPSKDEARALQNIYETAKKQKKHEAMYAALKNKGR